MAKAKGGFYAVKKGRVPGIYGTWDECTEQVKGFPGAAYKKFGNLADAEAWVAGVATASSVKISSSATESVEVQPTGSAPVKDGEWEEVYTDGACPGNGQPGSVAGVGVWWGKNDSRNISERCPGVPTNNRAELIAIIRVFETTKVSRKPLLIKTDSAYSINCFEKWLPGWIRKGFRTSKGEEIKNLGLIQYLAALLKERGMGGQKIKLQHVRGHSGIPGNDGADELAVAGSTLPELPDRDWEALRLAVEERMLNMDMKDAKKVEVTVEENKVMIVEEEEVDPSIFEDMILDDDALAEMGRTGDFDKY